MVASIDVQVLLRLRPYPRDGALALVKSTHIHSSTSLMCHSWVHAKIGVMCTES